MVAVNTATQSDPVMGKAHTHGDLQTKVTFQQKGRERKARKCLEVFRIAEIPLNVHRKKS
jgi:hypothetical protein